ncbi:hypothetical protein [Mucilaginibacter boryungensis]|uniref:Outer membrane protein with beta-barrel domain n=1 Tax=Mucilaginibacter boryungensis TaxID=768480 RepID=A0ABR9XIW8_9SPHI|nr:hypothetical protein [Mucilaginibacter boryungensis]MBE9667216.1 hypothetical protein [Mucilaginibacter boryungensis]
MKKFIFTLLTCASFLMANAQIGYNYAQYDFGLSGAVNSAHTDFAKTGSSYAAQVHFTYNYSPYINYIAEVQIGGLNGSDLTAVIPGSDYTFTNNYSMVALRAQIQLGEIIDYSQSQFKNAFKNIYFSGGVGVIYTDLTVNEPTLGPIESKGSNIFIPLKAGYEFKFFNSYSEPKVKLDIGYQYNMVLSDNFDGITYGTNKDAFSQIVVGLKFAIGGYTSYRKSINY